MKHKSMWVKTEKGNVAHVLAAPNMSVDTMSAINQIIDLVNDPKAPLCTCNGLGCKKCKGLGKILNS